MYFSICKSIFFVIDSDIIMYSKVNLKGRYLGSVLLFMYSKKCINIQKHYRKKDKLNKFRRKM